MSQFPKAERQWNKVFHERPTENSEESHLVFPPEDSQKKLTEGFVK